MEKSNASRYRGFRRAKASPPTQPCRAGDTVGRYTLISASAKAEWERCCSERDVFVNSDTCAESDLAACALDGEFLFLREDVPRRSGAHNLWTVQTNEQNGTLAGASRQLSDLHAVVMSQLTGSRDGRTAA